MKIRAYPFLQQESQAPRAGENNNAPSASRRSLSLPEEECSRSNGVSEKMRTQIRTGYAKQVMTEIKEKLANIPHTFTASEVNRQNIAVLLR